MTNYLFRSFIINMKLNLFTQKNISTLMPFNKGGNRIISRIPTKFSASEAPLGTKRAEKLIIEREFGNKKTNVNLYYDSKDRLIGQKRENYQGKTLLDYIESRYTIRKNSAWEKYLISISDVQSITYASDNSIKSGVRHKVDIVKEAGIEKPSINIMKYKTVKNKDNNYTENFSISNGYNHIITDAERSEAGDLLQITTNASENIPKEITNDEYLVLRSMPDEIAIKSLVRTLGKKEKLEHLDNIKLFYIKGDDINYVQGVSLQNENKLGVGTLPTLGYNINTVAHELRHFKQRELKAKLKTQLWNKFFNPQKFNQRELNLALHFLKCRMLECPFPVTKLTEKWYSSSKIEEDAFRIGERYEADFQRRTTLLKKFFPKITTHNLGLEPTLPN